MAVKWPTLDEITKAMVEELSGTGKTIVDLPKQWLIKVIILAVRAVVYLQVLASKAAYDARSPFTATGDDLDAVCEEMSATVRRRPAVKARVVIRLSRSSPASADVPIPAGSLVTSQAVGDQVALDFFSLVNDNGNVPAITSGNTFVDVVFECSVAGTAGNLTSSSVVFPGMVGVDSAKVMSLEVEGTDLEDDEVLRDRLLEELANQEKGGTAADYEIWAKRVTGVVSARSIPLARGNGTVDVVITGTGGLPTQTLIDEVQEYIDGLTPAGGADVDVKSPTPVEIHVTATVELEDGALWSTVQPLILVALDDVIAKENDVLIVRLNKIREVIGDVPGVFNFTVTAPVADVPLDSGELALPGTYIISEAV